MREGCAMKKNMWIIGCVVVSIMLSAGSARPATMNDYCVTPPFIQTPILPNLLLLIDNSASMYDLAYADTGRKSCSNSTGTVCTSDTDCPSGGACSNFLRQPYYCYDQTFSSVKTYVGYFDSSKLYKYVGDFSAQNPGEFVEETAAFSCTAAGTDVAKSISSQLCVIYTSANKANKFIASGNYLNWLTASKFDVQKEILTGGKFDGTHLLAESRGCVGQSFIKEANTANFVNFTAPDTNTALGITFGIRGPYDAVNASAPSPGGQTYIDIFKGNYNQGNCQAAMDAIVTGGNADIKQTVAACLASTTETTAVTKAKVVFQQSMQACWQKREGHAIGGDDINTVKNQCTDVYSAFATCSNDPKKVCTTATVATDCGAGNTCVYGPPAIVPGNSALLCGNEYEGQYYYLQGAGTAGTCTYNGAACTTNADCVPATVKQCKKTDNYCTTNADCPGSGNSCSKTIANTCSTSVVAAGWKLIPGVTEAQMIETHNQFCSDMSATPVIDPTDAPSDTSKYDNVPSILSGVGVEAQLSQPVGTLTVKLKKPAETDGTIKAPTGVISDFSSQVRIGAMTFNFAGSAAEATAGTLSAPMICSNSDSANPKVCTSNIDCVSPATCNATTAGTSNKDGGKIIHYVGTGHCSSTVATVCYNDANCPSGEQCLSDGVGTYSSGLVKAVNDIKAQAWTPFAEAFYDVIGYFAKTSSGTSRTDLRLNATDFDENRNPSQYRCQSNNLLLISDGMSTADRHSSVDNLAKLYTAAGGSTSWTTGAGACPSYAGSVNLDNMAWIGRNLKINSFSTSAASAVVALADKQRNEYVTSYVVFNGDSNGQAGECDSKTLLSQTASKGGTTLYQAVDPAALDTALREAFKAIASGVASGTAASILSNSEGSGANLLQAVFYPQKTFATPTGATTPTTASWIGEMQNLWYYVDPFISNSTVREDTDFSSTSPHHVLNLKNDYSANFYFQNSQALVELKRDVDGDGIGDTVINSLASPDDVSSIWRAGKQLWARTADSRTIHTSIDGVSLLSPTLAGGGFYSGITRATALQPYLQAADLDESKKIIDYVRGTDQTGYRNRTVQIGSGASTSDNTKVWKLGDIVSSTPRIQSTSKLNSYSLDSPQGYGDKSHKAFTSSANYQKRGMVYVGANDGMLHAFKLGKLTVSGLSDVPSGGGYLSISGYTKATLTGTSLGEEQWSYIPRNALPYLKYYTDINYKHIFSVDGQTLLADVAVGSCAGESDPANCTKDETNGSNWRTVLIGSMGLGGASRIKDNGCVDGINGTCVKTPIFDPANAAAGVGYSSLFALDITNQYFNSDGSLANQPTLKWELARPDLGYTTAGVAIVKISGKKTVIDGASTKVVPDNTKNGKWFAVYASGPTGPINPTSSQFLGKSDQNLKLFVVDLAATAPLVENTNYWVIDTGIKRAFGGIILNGVIDTDRWSTTLDGNYQDDVIYLGYTKANIADADAVTAATAWTEGGVLRILTKEDTDPSKWGVSTLISGTGPVTAGVAKLQDRKCKKLWLYFGSGRYYYGSDDKTGQRYILGLQDPCYTADNKIDKNCTEAALGLGNLIHRTNTCEDIGSKKGWYISLGAEDTVNTLDAERLISDPAALTNGTVYFSTFRPTADICSYGGNTYMRAVGYNNGCLPHCNALTGKALLQMSTGSFEQLDFSTLFACFDGPRTSCDGNYPGGLPPIKEPPPPTGQDPGFGGPDPNPNPNPNPVPAPTPPITGKGPQEFPILSNSGNKPLKKILHIREK